ncbi:MAG TPA: fumarate hydratase, partial [Candidatus Ozemobacteraceae bacterium]|nr:fumarate hydratase [Candidatus Ozemobacteraceae bacterium]
MSDRWAFSPQNPELRVVTTQGIRRRVDGESEWLEVETGVLRQLAAEAFRDLAFYLRPSQLEAWAVICRDPLASDNDRFVAAQLLRNAVISAEGVLPLCQDTGTATIFARRGYRVITAGTDESELLAGVGDAWSEHCLRASQMVPTTLFVESNSGNNLPAMVEIRAVAGTEYELLFMAKGGGSANRTMLFQKTPAILNESAFETFLREQLRELGVAACPPYRLAVVVGGLSPEHNLETLKLATAEALDHLPGAASGATAFRDIAWEERVCRLAAEQPAGAKFGGRWFALSARVIRLPRHAASCFISIGVSCSAHRQMIGRVTAEGAFLERLESAPSRFMPDA